MKEFINLLKHSISYCLCSIVVVQGFFTLLVDEELLRVRKRGLGKWDLDHPVRSMRHHHYYCVDS